MAQLIWSAMQAVLWIGVGFLNHAIGQETPIRHVVFIVKENRSFDHMFGRFPGANGATHGKISTGQILPLAHAPDAALNYGHGWVAAHNAMDCVSGICKGSMRKHSRWLTICFHLWLARVFQTTST